MVLRPAWSIHTAFMRFPIDVVFLDHDQIVIRIEHALRPSRPPRAAARARWSSSQRASASGAGWRSATASPGRRAALPATAPGGRGGSRSSRNRRGTCSSRAATSASSSWRASCSTAAGSTWRRDVRPDGIDDVSRTSDVDACCSTRTRPRRCAPAVEHDPRQPTRPARRDRRRARRERAPAGVAIYDKWDQMDEAIDALDRTALPRAGEGIAQKRPLGSMMSLEVAPRPRGGETACGEGTGQVDMTAAARSR